MLWDKFVGKIDLKKLINNRNLMFFASDEKFYIFFQNKMSINTWTRNLTNFLVFKKVVLDFSNATVAWNLRHLGNFSFLCNLGIMAFET